MKPKIIFILFQLLFYSFCEGQFSNQCTSENVFPAFNKMCNTNPWILTFEDNFDGNQIDVSKWNVREGVIRDSNHEREVHWLSPNNVITNNGSLKIVATKNIPPKIGTFVIDYSTNPPSTLTQSFDFSAGEIWTHDFFGFGKYEIRAKMPVENGFGTAFWTFGGVGWNEIDVFEINTGSLHHYPMDIHHFSGTQSNGNFGCQETWENGPDFSAAFHTFTMIWDFFKIEWYVDGNLVRTVYKFFNILGQPINCNNFQPFTNYIQNKAFPVEDMNIILNLAVKPGENGPNSITSFPAIFEIDYVRYWRKDPVANSCNHVVVKGSPFTGTHVGDWGLLTENASIEAGTAAEVIVREQLYIQPNFHAKAGSYFHAKADPIACGTSARNGEADLIDTTKSTKNQNATPEGQLAIRNTLPTLFPNPTTGSLTIAQLEQFAGGKLEVTNLMGQTVFSQPINATTLTLSLAQQPKGIYLVKISSATQNVVQKVVLE